MDTTEHTRSIHTQSPSNDEYFGCEKIYRSRPHTHNQPHHVSNTTVSPILYTSHRPTSPRATRAFGEHRVPFLASYSYLLSMLHIFPLPNSNFLRTVDILPNSLEAQCRRQCTIYPSLYSPHTPPWPVYTSTTLPSYASPPAPPNPHHCLQAKHSHHTGSQIAVRIIPSSSPPLGGFPSRPRPQFSPLTSTGVGEEDVRESTRGRD